MAQSKYTPEEQIECIGADLLSDIEHAVTLSIEESDRLCDLLRAFASERFEHARKTKSAAIREYCRTQAEQAETLHASIVRRQYEVTR